MFRKGEPQLAAVVERTFRKLGSNRDLIPLYNKWFVARLPTGEKLNVAISPQLEEAFKVLDDSPGGSNSWPNQHCPHPKVLAVLHSNARKMAPWMLLPSFRP